MKIWPSKCFGPGLWLRTLGSNPASQHGQEFYSDARVVLHQGDVVREAVPAPGQRGQG